MRKPPYAAVAFLTAVALRLYPAIVSGLPYSTDGWPIIRNTELLVKKTPIGLDDEAFDGYNNYWPASSVFGALLAQATGLKPVEAMRVGIPLAGAVAVLIFYALVEGFAKDRGLALTASMLLAAMFPYALFTAGVTKETFANPIYMLCLLLFLTRRGWRGLLLFTVASTALASAHHLTPMVTATVLASVALAETFYRVKQGLDIEKTSLLYLSILTATTALYFAVFAHRGFKIAVTYSDVISAASYQIVAFASTLYLAFKPYTYSRRALLSACFVAVVTASTVALLSTKRPVVPGAPVLPGRYMFYATAFILAAPLLTLGFDKLCEIGGEGRTALPFWLTTILGFEGYAVFGNPPIGLTLAYRMLNFLCPPLAVICAFGLYRLCPEAGGPRKENRMLAAAVLLSILAISSYSLYAAVSLQERYMGYFWLYRPPEYAAGSWVSSACGGCTVACDVKFAYLFKYFGLKVSEFQGLLYLSGKASSKPEILLVYDQMLEKGYVVYGGYSVDLPEGWMERVYSLNLVYSNGLVKLHSG